MSRKRQNAIGRTVYVIDQNIGQAIKKLRRIMRQNNIFKELKQKEQYTKPSVIKKQKNALKKWKCKIWEQQRNKKQYIEK